MDSFLFMPSGTPHRVVKITGTPSFLKQLDFTPAGTGDKVYIVQPTGGDVRFTLNPGDGPVVGERGIVLKDCKITVFSHNEMVESQWVAEGGKTVNLQVSTAIDRAMR